MDLLQSISGGTHLARHFYQSLAHHPYQFWTMLGLFALFLAIRSWGKTPKRFSAPFWVFTLTTCLDAWLMTEPKPVGFQRPIGPDLAQALSIGFVILGDFRLFWFTALGKTLSARLWAATAVSFAVPVAAAIVRAYPTFPRENLRVVFFSYELIFLVWIGLLYFDPKSAVSKILKSAKCPVDRERFRKLVGLPLVYYVLWAVADAFILFVQDPVALEWAWGSRMLANLGYYGLLLPWIWVRMQRS